MDKITVKLQDPYSYTLWPIIVVGVIVLAPIVFMIIRAIIRWFMSRKKKPVQKPVEKPAEPQPVKISDQGGIKEKYLAILKSIADRKNSGEISNRIGHQELSVAIRNFVKEMTGINVQNCTLSEIDKDKMPQLYYIIKECYIPEFATDEVAEAVDVIVIIDKAKKVIEEWN